MAINSNEIVDLRVRSAKKAGNISGPQGKGASVLKDQAKADFFSNRVYSPANFSKQSMKTFGRSNKRNRRPKILGFLIILLFCLVAAGIAGYFFFGGNSVTSNALKLTLASADNVISGDLAGLDLTYENLDKAPLTNLEIVVQYPDGFIYSHASSEPINSEKNIWHPENLPVGQSQTLHLEGYLVGDIGDDKEFSVIFQYQPENFNSNFKENIVKKIHLNDALLRVEINAPSTIDDGQKVDFKVNFQNQTKEDINDLHFSFDFGDAFRVLGTTPSTTNATWVKEKLLAGESGDLEAIGLIDASKGNPWNWYFSAWKVIQENGQDVNRLMYQHKGQMQINKSDLLLKVELADPDKKYNWGDNVDYKISYQNNGQITIKQAVLKLAINGRLDWDKFQNASNATRDNNTLVWLSTSGDSTKDLAEIAPQGQGSLTVTVPLIAQPENLANLQASDLEVKATALLMARINNEEKTFTSSELSFIISSQPRLVAEAKYNLDGKTKVGDGPLPPQIGQTTKYRIYWKVFAGPKDLKNAVIKTTLPSYINWVSQVDKPNAGSELKFDSGSRQLVWQIGDLAANSGAGASFDISVTPVDSQVNQLLILTNPTLFTAAEKESNLPISQTAGLISSDLIGDTLAQGKGRVVVGK